MRALLAAHAVASEAAALGRTDTPIERLDGDPNEPGTVAFWKIHFQQQFEAHGLPMKISRNIDRRAWLAAVDVVKAAVRNVSHSGSWFVYQEGSANATN